MYRKFKVKAGLMFRTLTTEYSFPADWAKKAALNNSFTYLKAVRRTNPMMMKEKINKPESMSLSAESGESVFFDILLTGTDSVMRVSWLWGITFSNESLGAAALMNVEVSVLEIEELAAVCIS